MNPSLYFNILFLAFSTLQTAVVSAVSVEQIIDAQFELCQSIPQL